MLNKPKRIIADEYNQVGASLALQIWGVFAPSQGTVYSPSDANGYSLLSEMSDKENINSQQVNPSTTLPQLEISVAKESPTAPPQVEISAEKEPPAPPARSHIPAKKEPPTTPPRNNPPSIKL